MFGTEKFGSYVSNEWHLEGEAKKLVSPTTGEEWGKLHFATDQTIKQAIDRVKDAPTIDLPPYERAKILWEIKDEILANQEELAKCITLEMGKPINDARGEVIYTANYFGWFAEEVKRIYGKKFPLLTGIKKWNSVMSPSVLVDLLLPGIFQLQWQEGKSLQP